MALCGEDRRAVNSLVVVVREHAVSKMIEQRSQLPTGLLMKRLSGRVMERTEIAPERVIWALWIWARAMGLSDLVQWQETTSAPAQGDSG